ncbi:MAG TPA: transcriptional repressor [Methylomirabilota bacterium]|jgi:Fe2+ or Zn2+ uptake regulation protein|nr:transcriptional repressor [Methylomirabilota bacterium]
METPSPAARGKDRGRPPSASAGPARAEVVLRADLARRGMRLTDQRRLILAAVQATNTHPTAEWVHAAVRKQLPRVSLATVYRNLRLLARHGLLTEFQAGPTVRFDARVHRHHHFTCAHCGRIFDLEEPVDARLDARVTARTGFRVSHHRIEFFGLCGRCARRRGGGPTRRPGPD